MSGPDSRHRLCQPVRAIPLLAMGLALRFVAEMLAGGAATAMALAGFAAVLAFVAINLHLSGTLVVGVGIALNAMVMALNGAMPVDPDAAVSAGLIDRADVADAEWRGPRRATEDGDRLAALGDRIPLGFARRVVSFGDLILVVGLIDLGIDLARRSKNRPRGRP